MTTKKVESENVLPVNVTFCFTPENGAWAAYGWGVEGKFGLSEAQGRTGAFGCLTEMLGTSNMENVQFVSVGMLLPTDPPRDEGEEGN